MLFVYNSRYLNEIGIILRSCFELNLNQKNTPSLIDHFIIMSKKKQFPLHMLLGTANKNIYSGFMRSDMSYFCKEEEIWPRYRKETDTIRILQMTNENIIISDLEECENTKIDSSNKSVSPEKASLLVSEQQTSEESEYEKSNLAVVNKKQAETLLTAPDLFENGHLSEKFILESLFYKDKLLSLKDNFICLIFKDTIKREEILFLIQFILNYKQAKGILLLPESLSVTASICVPSAIIIYRNSGYVYFSIVEDYVLIDTKILFDDERKSLEEKEIFSTSIFSFFKSELEFVDEFEPISARDSHIICDLCHEWLLEEDSINHVVKTHCKSFKCECLKKSESTNRQKKQKKENGEVPQNEDSILDHENGIKKRRRRRTKQEMIVSKNLEMQKKIEALKNPKGFTKNNEEDKEEEKEANNINEEEKLYDSTKDERETPNTSQDPSIPGQDPIDSKKRRRRRTKPQESNETIQPETIKNKFDQIQIHAKTHVVDVFTGETQIDKIYNFINLYLKKDKSKNNTVICDSELIEQLLIRNKEINFIDLETSDLRKGATNLLNIELAKELWMTDKEWNATRLRILKEKLLFYL